jgi:hypothetical protein
MHLNELTVRITHALLKDRRLRRAGADHRVSGLLPKIAPMPPVAKMIASAGKLRNSIVRRSSAVMPRATPFSSITAERNSQPSYFLTLPSDSWRRTCSSRA